MFIRTFAVTKERPMPLAEEYDFGAEATLDTVSGECKVIQWRQPTGRRFTFSSEPTYIKLYVDHVCSFKQLGGGQKSLLLCLLEQVSWASDDKPMTVSISSGLKQVWASELGMSVKSINNYLVDLVKKGVISRIGRGYYMLNPDYFGKGDWRDIKRLRAMVEYDEDGVTWKLVDKEQGPRAL